MLLIYVIDDTRFLTMLYSSNKFTTEIEDENEYITEIENILINYANRYPELEMFGKLQ